METTVSKIEDQVDMRLSSDLGGGATKNLAFAQRHNLRYYHTKAGLLQRRPNSVQRRIELYRSDHCYGFARRKIARERIQKVSRVDRDVHENIQRRNFCCRHGDQATMRIVNEQVATESSRRVIINTTRPIRDIPHNKCFDSWT